MLCSHISLGLFLMPIAHAHATGWPLASVTPLTSSATASCKTPCCTGHLCGLADCHANPGSPTAIDPSHTQGLSCPGGGGWSCCAKGTNEGQLCESPEACGFTCPEYHPSPPLPEGCYKFQDGDGGLHGHGFPANYGDDAPRSTTIIDISNNGNNSQVVKTFALFSHGGPLSKAPSDPYITCIAKWTASITYVQPPPISAQGSSFGFCDTVLVWTPDNSTLTTSGPFDYCHTFEPPTWDHTDGTAFPWKPYGSKSGIGGTEVYIGISFPEITKGPLFAPTTDCSGAVLACSGHLFSWSCFMQAPWPPHVIPGFFLLVSLPILFCLLKCFLRCARNARRRRAQEPLLPEESQPSVNNDATPYQAADAPPYQAPPAESSKSTSGGAWGFYGFGRGNTPPEPTPGSDAASAAPATDAPHGA